MRYAIALSISLLVVLCVAQFRMVQLPYIPWGGFDWFGITIMIACSLMTTLTIAEHWS